MEKIEYCLYIVGKAWNANIGLPLFPHYHEKGGNPMIKGVNKKVIEINHPDSVYFERAVLYLRPDIAEVPMHEAQAETESYLQSAPAVRSKKQMKNWACFLLGALTSAAVLLLAVWLISPEFL